MIPEFWLSYNNNKEKLRLPVPPAVVNVTSPFSNTTIDVVHGGQFTIIGERGLKEFSFATFFPRDYNETYCDYRSFPTPQKCVATVEKWRDTRKPIRFLVTGTNINMPVTVDDLDYDVERAGEPGDIYFSIRLKEHPFLTIGKKIDVKKGAKQTSKRPPVVNKGTSTKPGGTYTVKNNDTLQKIAHAVYNKTSRWPDIFNANRKVIGADPNKIIAGMRLVLPK